MLTRCCPRRCLRASGHERIVRSLAEAGPWRCRHWDMIHCWPIAGPWRCLCASCPRCDNNCLRPVPADAGRARRTSGDWRRRPCWCLCPSRSCICPSRSSTLRSDTSPSVDKVSRPLCTKRMSFSSTHVVPPASTFWPWPKSACGPDQNVKQPRRDRIRVRGHDRRELQDAGVPCHEGLGGLGGLCGGSADDCARCCCQTDGGSLGGSSGSDKPVSGAHPLHAPAASGRGGAALASLALARGDRRLGHGHKQREALLDHLGRRQRTEPGPLRADLILGEVREITRSAETKAVAKGVARGTISALGGVANAQPRCRRVPMMTGPTRLEA
jgi:hypothetical protein